MSWLDEALAINAEKAKEAKTDFGGECSTNTDILLLDTQEDIECFKTRVREEYEDATDREIEHAVEKIKERFSSPYSLKEVLSYIKQFVGSY